MTAMLQPKVAQTNSKDSEILKSDKGTARMNDEGILEIEELFEEVEVPKKVQQKRTVKGIEFVGDPFSSVTSPADLANISKQLQAKFQNSDSVVTASNMTN